MDQNFWNMKMIQQFCFLMVLGLLLLSCGAEEKKEETTLRPVKYMEIGFLGGEESRTFSGTARTEKIINLSFRNSGIITQFDLKLGQKVKKGQLLAKLDNVQSRLAYEQSITQLNSAASQVNTAKLSLNRVRTLYEKGYQMVMLMADGVALANLAVETVGQFREAYSEG